jgi:hypothetical protein
LNAPPFTRCRSGVPARRMAVTSKALPDKRMRAQSFDRLSGFRPRDAALHQRLPLVRPGRTFRRTFRTTADRPDCLPCRTDALQVDMENAFCRPGSRPPSGRAFKIGVVDESDRWFCRFE